MTTLPPTLSKAYAVGLPSPWKVASHTQTPYEYMTIQLRLVIFTTKIQYDGLIFAKNCANICIS